MNLDSLPEGISADYVNEAVETQMHALLDTPDYERLAAFMNTLREGFLFTDVTGAVSRKKGARVRTTRTTRGQLVLPIFTSMENLRAAVSSKGRRVPETKGALMPSLEALRIIETDRFVAVEINPGARSLVVLRKYISLLLDGSTIDAGVLEGMK